MICLEPTDNTLQLGCLGNINARVVFEGRAAHSARPWLGVNAIELALEGLRGVLELEPNDVEIDGLVFREVVSVTQIDDCGNASNVIPGRVEATLNYRFAPDPHAGGGRGAPGGARRARARDHPVLRRRARCAPLAARRAAARGRRVRGRAEAGLDERRRLRRPRARRAQPRPRRDALRPHGRRAGRDRRARHEPSTRSSASSPGSCTVQLSPLLAELEQYPFARLDDWRAEARRRGLEVIDFGVGDPREPTPAFIREALVAGVPRGLVVSAGGRAARVPRGGRGVDRARASASSSTRRSRSCRRSARRRRSSPSPRWRSARGGAWRCPGRPTRSTSAARSSRAPSCVTRPAARGARLAARSRRVRPLGRDRHLLDVLPEQPDRRDRAALVLRGARRRGRASTASCSAPTRRTRSSGSARSRSRRSRSPTARTSSSSTRSRSARR